MKKVEIGNRVASIPVVCGKGVATVELTAIRGGVGPRGGKLYRVMITFTPSESKDKVSCKITFKGLIKFGSGAVGYVFPIASPCDFTRLRRAELMAAILVSEGSGTTLLIEKEKITLNSKLIEGGRVTAPTTLRLRNILFP